MRHVLIIEGETLIALDLQAMLAGLGAASFDVVASEAEAVEAAGARRPDLITADVVLKAGLGSSAVREITRRHGVIPVLYVTSTPEACTVNTTTRVLRKPADEAEVASAVRALLAGG